MASNNATLLCALATGAFIAMVAVNALANALPINGLDTGDVADLYPNLFTPAGFTFSIWSVIYALLALFIVHIWFNRHNEQLAGVLVPFIISCIFNISWILVWHHLLPFLSVLVMLLLLLTLGYLFRITRTRKLNQFMVTLPFTIYFSWICVATIANISAWFVSMGWNAFMKPEAAWALIMIVVACGLSVFVTLRYKSTAFPLVTAWAFIGIMAQAQEVQNDVVRIGSLCLAIGLFLLAVGTAIKAKTV